MIGLLVLAVCAVAAALLAAPLVGSAETAAGQRADASSQGTLARSRPAARRVGGTVRRAWPATGRRPRTRQARWLARQVGATTRRRCARNWRHARRRCHLGAPPRRSGHGAAAMSITGGDAGSPPGTVVRIDAVSTSQEELAAVADPLLLPLKLIRSYAIPADDPAYHRLLNWSWSYDSAVAAAALVSTGDKSNAAQLLDQLAALQHTDGSLEIAFDTSTGESANVFRAGTVAWFGLAAATYDRTFPADGARYREAERRAADYLLTLQTGSGLVKGGPDVEWVSTQHNLITYVFLARLAKELQDAGSTAAAAGYQKAATTIATAITADLLVDDASGTHFLEGLRDPTPALDVQALGAMFLQGVGQPALAAQVLAYTDATFAVGGRSVTPSSDPGTFNLTYSAKGPFSGYAPYAGAGAPDVLWAEGTGEVRLAKAALGQDTGVLDAAIAAWAAITPVQGPLQADRKITDGGYEYHAWPASTAAAWTVLSRSAPAFFAAPLPSTTTLVTGWTKVRGGNLITTYSDGRVNMTTGNGGERRVLAASTASDYTVTANVTLLSGAGYGIYVRANTDSATKLTGYCVQLDRGFGQLVVRALQADVELAPPIARIALPAGFTWYGVPHTLGITVKGNTMNITLDGAQMANLPDLAALWAVSIKYTYPSGAVSTAPTAGPYGMRSWGDGFASLQQMTVTSQD